MMCVFCAAFLCEINNNNNKRACEGDVPDLLDASVEMHTIIIIIIIITRQVQHIKEKKTHIQYKTAQHNIKQSMWPTVLDNVYRKKHREP